MQVYAVCFSPKEHNEPLLYYKGDQLLRKGYPFFLPKANCQYMAAPALAIRIGRLGKGVQPQFAHKYVEAIGVGFDIIEQPTLNQIRAQALPWDAATAFAESAAACFVEYDATQLGLPDAIKVSTAIGSANSQTFYVEHTTIRQAIANYAINRMIKQGDVLLIRSIESRELLCDDAYNLQIGQVIDAECEIPQLQTKPRIQLRIK